MEQNNDKTLIIVKAIMIASIIVILQNLLPLIYKLAYTISNFQLDTINNLFH